VAPTQAPALATDTAEHHLLLLALNHEQLGRALAAAIPHDWIDTGHIAGTLLNRVLAEFEQNSWPGREHLEALLETPEERTLVATLIFNALELDDPAKVAAAGLQQLRARALEPRLRQIELALANPQPDSDFDPISLLKERSELQRQLRQPITLNLVG
jgi:DNA primase